MELKLSFHGGVGEVTGSRFLLEAGKARLLLDCGLFQGHRHEAIKKNKDLPFDPRSLDAVLLSHAHIDHSGGLPLLAKRGLEAPIHCTAPTAEICGPLLLDSARIQEEDAKFFNKIHSRAGDKERIAPLYGQDEARLALKRLAPHDYGAAVPLGDGLSARFLNAGHILGSALVQVDAIRGASRRRVLFTGDLGRRKSLLLDPPEAPRGVDYLLVETTYGGRRHEPFESAGEKLAGIVSRAAAEKGKVLIPSFALERTQEMAFTLERLFREGKAPRVPVILDSPLAAEVTEVFRRNAGHWTFGPEVEAFAEKYGDPFGFESVRTVRSSEESKSLNELEGPLVIISSSGMCEGGRILHHLRNSIADDSTTVVMVGYQAQGTLGRRLLDGAKKVKIFGLEHEVWARVEAVQSFSAHADQEDLLWFVKSLEPRPRRIFLVHGDDDQRQAFAERLKAEGIDRVESPGYGDSFSLD